MVRGTAWTWWTPDSIHSGFRICDPGLLELFNKACVPQRGSGGLAGGPASSSPGPALFLVEEGPGQQAALLLTLTHGDYPHIPYRQCGQPGTQGRQVGGPGHQGGEPEHLTRSEERRVGREWRWRGA